MAGAKLRIARPVSVLERSVAMYRRGLGLREIDRFEDHAGFDGVMLGAPELEFQFEFTYRRAYPISPSPTPEDIVVFYLRNLVRWHPSPGSMLEAGFAEVRPLNPYWEKHGRTFEDHDGYRVVLI